MVGHIEACSDDRGFTLIEILLATVILTVGLLAMASLTVSIIRGNSLSNRATTATTLAQDEMQRIKRVGYANITATTENYNTIPNYPGYKRETKIDVDIPAVAMKTVTVTISWDSDARKMFLKTILAQ